MFCFIFYPNVWKVTAYATAHSKLLKSFTSNQCRFSCLWETVYAVESLC